ncbi:MAG: hypothetical protein HUJ64_01885 [Limosilactobacillus mucosae]|nr:hypothetical protein [Limosilactobacillus mucosae]
MSLNMFGSPASYIQGSDVLFKSAEYLARLGNRVLLLAGPTSLRIVGNEFAGASFEYIKQGLGVGKIAVELGNACLF